MIVPMKKCYIVALESERHELPRSLRKLGIVHIQEITGSGETYSALERDLALARNARGALAARLPPKFKPAQRKGHEAAEQGRQLAEKVLDLLEEIDTIEDRLAYLEKECERAASWGEVSKSMLEEAEASGFRIHLFEAPAKAAGDAPADLVHITLAAPKGKLHWAVLLPKGGVLPPLPPSFAEFVPPEQTPAAMRQTMVQLSTRHAELERTLADAARDIDLLDAYLASLESSLVLERLRSGMPGEGTFCYLAGYIPEPAMQKLRTAASEHGWAVAFEDPSAEELPPTLVDNPPAVRIIEPVFEFLGTVPNYREYDISFWFLLFFSLFFAMIFGDGGYGTLILGGSLAAILGRLRKKQVPGNAEILFALLGAVTVIWGALTASWFGIAYDRLPAFLQNISIPLINGQHPDSESNIKVFCFIIGLVQLSIAHFKNIRRDYPDLKFLSQVGSLLLLAGMFNAALNLVIDSQRFPIRSWALASIGAGFLLVFVFGNWNGKLGSSLIESLKGFIPTFLGTVSVFADIVSYIRLWAVGLAGLAISQTVNGMAGSIVGGVAAFAIGFMLKLLIAIVLLVVSHSLNFVLTVLSVVVHGIRLNMLEFSGHLGMEWSGYKYEPLKETDSIGGNTAIN